MIYYRTNDLDNRIFILKGDKYVPYVKSYGTFGNSQYIPLPEVQCLIIDDIVSILTVSSMLINDDGSVRIEIEYGDNIIGLIVIKRDIQLYFKDHKPHYCALEDYSPEIFKVYDTILP